jgi:hypothetical protein
VRDEAGKVQTALDERDHLSKADMVIIAVIEAGVPMLVKARGLIDRFHAMIRKKALSE